MTRSATDAEPYDDAQHYLDKITGMFRLNDIKGDEL